MKFDQENHINKLCAQGTMLEGKGRFPEAKAVFLQVWAQANHVKEKFTAVHFASHQDTLTDKLRWGETALNYATQVNDPLVICIYPSLYLNIAKCHEDLKDPERAKKNTNWHFIILNPYPNDGYSSMIRAWISNGISRVQAVC